LYISVAQRRNIVAVISNVSLFSNLPYTTRGGSRPVRSFDVSVDYLFDNENSVITRMYMAAEIWAPVEWQVIGVSWRLAGNCDVSTSAGRLQATTSVRVPLLAKSTAHQLENYP